MNQGSGVFDPTAPSLSNALGGARLPTSLSNNASARATPISAAAAAGQQGVGGAPKPLSANNSGAFAANNNNAIINNNGVINGVGGGSSRTGTPLLATASGANNNGSHRQTPIQGNATNPVANSNGNNFNSAMVDIDANIAALAAAAGANLSGTFDPLSSSAPAGNNTSEGFGGGGGAILYAGQSDAAVGGGGGGGGMPNDGTAASASSAAANSSSLAHAAAIADMPPGLTLQQQLQFLASHEGSGRGGGGGTPTPTPNGGGGGGGSESRTNSVANTHRGDSTTGLHSNNINSSGTYGGNNQQQQHQQEEVAFASRYHSPGELRETAMAAINQSIDAALKAEVKRMREEVTRLRKESQRANQLADEVKFLRNVTLLQHEEKVPIRLRELERDNLSLRRQVATLEEKLKTYENDEYRQRLALQRTALGGGGGGSGSGVGGGAMPMGLDGAREDGDGGKGGGVGDDGSGGAGLGRRSGSLRRRTMSMSPHNRGGKGGVTSNNGGGGGGGGGGGSGKVDIIVKTGDALDSCVSCRLKIAAMERVTRADKKELQEALSITQSRLNEANKELEAIQNWVKSVVAGAHQFPNTAAQQPSLERVANFANPAAASASTNFVNRQLDPRSSLGSQYYQQYADPHVKSMSGLAWSSSVAPQPSYLEARRR